MMANDEMEPVIQAKRPSANAPVEGSVSLPIPAVDPKVDDVVAPPLSPPPVVLPRPVLDAASLSYRSTRKELISVFVACTHLNLPQLPQTFFQSIFKGKKPDTNLPEIRVEVDIKPVGDDAAKASTVFHHTTEALRVKNPSFSVGLTIPVPVSKANSDEYHLHFRVVQTDVGLEKTVATTEMMCGLLLESFKQGSPVVHLPLLASTSQEAILSLTLARVFPIKHNVLPTQNMLMHMYAFPQPKRKDTSTLTLVEQAPLLASEELVEVGYATSLPPLFLQQCTDEMVAAHRLWSVRYANARKSALLFDSPDEALANGCDVYSVEVISGKGLALPADLVLQPPPPSAPVTPTNRSPSAANRSPSAANRSPSAANRSPTANSGGTRSRTSSNASKEMGKQPVVTCNPFVAVKFKEASKGQRPVEVTEGRTPVEKNTGDPHWGDSVVGAKTAKPIEFYRPNEGQPAHSLRRTLEFDVLSVCDAHYEGEIALGKVILPVDAVMYEGKCAAWDINLTRWLPVLSPSGEERGEILIRVQMRRTTTVFSLDVEPSYAHGSLFHLADPKRQLKFQAALDAKNHTPASLSIADIKDLVASHSAAVDQLRAWQAHVEAASTDWFRSSEHKAKADVQPLTTNLHVSYFRLYAGVEPARATVLQGRPRDVEIDVLPGEDLSASTRYMLGHGGGGSRFSLEDLVDLDSPLQVDATYSTVTCGAPTAHGLGLSQFGLVELEDKLLSVESPVESYRCTYALRKAVCMSQALCVLAATFTSQLELVLQKSVPNHEWLLEQWATVGYLIGWESLVSTQGKELHMLSDAWVAIKSLERVQIQLVSHGELTTFAPSPDSDEKYVLQLPLPSPVFGLLPQALQDGRLVGVTSVLFTQGINEMQTLANVVGAVGIALQERINDKCCLALGEYHERLMAVPSLQGMTAQMKHLKLDALSAFIANSNESTMTKKNHRILLEASDDIRRLNGGRVTFCKSGKDRTAMSVTLDQARVVGSLWKHAPMMLQDASAKQDWALLKPVANLMREFGVRIEVAKKNVGQPRYSFNGLQRKLLPKMYRPPRGAIIKGDHDVDDS